MRLMPKVSDFRALAGAVALLLVGIHLSIMSGLYFLMDRQSFEMFHTGWWWEIALNLQIVCYFLMYLCHRGRMQHEVRWRRIRARFRFAIAMLGVSVPSILLIVAARGSWFEYPPEQHEVIFFISVVFGLWVLVSYILPYIVSRILPGKRLVHTRIGNTNGIGTLLYFSPLLLLLMLASVEMITGGKMHFILWPFFAYLQGGVLYLGAAFNPRNESEKGLVADEIQLAEGD